MLIVATSVQAYFREALVSAMHKSRLSFTESAQLYVVHLLNEFARSENAFAGAEQGQGITLAELMERALLADDHEAMRIFRHMGDSSLYLLGFFKESKQGGMVSLTYYMDMGAAAYSCASNLSRGYALNSAMLFQELSDRFGDVVKVVETIAHYGDEQRTI